MSEQKKRPKELDGKAPAAGRGKRGQRERVPRGKVGATSPKHMPGAYEIAGRDGEIGFLIQHGDCF